MNTAGRFSDKLVADKYATKRDEAARKLIDGFFALSNTRRLCTFRGASFQRANSRSERKSCRQQVQLVASLAARHVSSPTIHLLLLLLASSRDLLAQSECHATKHYLDFATQIGISLRQRPRRALCQRRRRCVPTQLLTLNFYLLLVEFVFICAACDGGKLSAFLGARAHVQRNQLKKLTHTHTHTALALRRGITVFR